MTMMMERTCSSDNADSNDSHTSIILMIAMIWIMTMIMILYISMIMTMILNDNTHNNNNDNDDDNNQDNNHNGNDGDNDDSDRSISDEVNNRSCKNKKKKQKDKKKEKKQKNATLGGPMLADQATVKLKTEPHHIQIAKMAESHRKQIKTAPNESAPRTGLQTNTWYTCMNPSNLLDSSQQKLSLCSGGVAIGLCKGIWSPSLKRSSWT